MYWLFCLIFRRDSLTDEHANLSDLPITVNVEGPSRQTSTEDLRSSMGGYSDDNFQKPLPPHQPPSRYNPSSKRFSRPPRGAEEYSIEESDSEVMGPKVLPGGGMNKHSESSRTITPITEQPPSPDYSSSPDEDSPTHTLRNNRKVNALITNTSFSQDSCLYGLYKVLFVQNS